MWFTSAYETGTILSFTGDIATNLTFYGPNSPKVFDPVDGDWVDEGSGVLTAGDKTFTEPGVIGSEAALYLEFE